MLLNLGIFTSSLKPRPPSFSRQNYCPRSGFLSPINTFELSLSSRNEQAISKMEQYLQYMRTLRSQMNDVEDQSTKTSVEEQTLLTTTQTLENDLKSAKSEVARVQEENEKLMRAKGLICTQILEKEKKVASLALDSTTLSQTLELVQQEKAGLSKKLMEKSDYYSKVTKDINSKLQEQQDWVSSQNGNIEVGEQGTGPDAKKMLIAELDSAKAGLDEISQRKHNLISDNLKVMQSIEKVKCSAKDVKPELLAMDMSTLEEEYRALLADKAGESEYLQSLRDQVKKLEHVSHVIKCGCRMEYNVAMDLMHDTNEVMKLGVGESYGDISLGT